MRSQIKMTQGSIVRNIRSLKYPDIPCYGIVITARCDFAQEKMRNLHLLTALPIQEWVDRVLVDQICQDKASKALKKLKGQFEREEYADGLVSCEPEGAEEYIASLGLAHDRTNRITNQYKNWLKETTILKSQNQLEKKKNAKGTLKNKLTNLYHSSMMNYCFIPKIGYERRYDTQTLSDAISSAIIIATEIDSSGKIVQSLREALLGLDQILDQKPTDDYIIDGLVVDVFDIIQLGAEHIQLIENERYDFLTLMDDKEKLRELNRSFYLNSEEDFVTIEHELKSPWIEYLMQHYSNAFIRIGVPNANDDQIDMQYQQIIDKWGVSI